MINFEIWAPFDIFLKYIFVNPITHLDHQFAKNCIQIFFKLKFPPILLFLFKKR